MLCLSKGSEFISEIPTQTVINASSGSRGGARERAKTFWERPPGLPPLFLGLDQPLSVTIRFGFKRPGFLSYFQVVTTYSKLQSWTKSLGQLKDDLM